MGSRTPVTAGAPRRPELTPLPPRPVAADLRPAWFETAEGEYHGPVTWSGTPDTSGVQIAVAQLTVEGMHCGSCVALIEETLNEREGVTAALVDLDSGRAVIEYDPSTLDVEQIRAAIAEVGYSAAPVN